MDQVKVCWKIFSSIVIKSIAISSYNYTLLTLLKPISKYQECFDMQNSSLPSLIGDTTLSKIHKNSLGKSFSLFVIFLFLHFNGVESNNHEQSYMWTSKLLPILPQYGLSSSHLLKDVKPSQSVYDILISLISFHDPPCRSTSYIDDPSIPQFLFPKYGPTGYPLIIILKPTSSDTNKTSENYKTDDEREFSMILGLIKESWDAYESYAFGSDELRPFTKQPLATYGLGTTLVDSLDTLWLAGFYGEFYKASEWVEMVFQKFTSCNGQNSFFEITIRILGGLLSAYCLSGWLPLLYASIEMGKRYKNSLKSVFSHQKIDLCLQKSSGPSISVADFSSHNLEFRTLYFLTGDIRYLQISDIHYRDVLQVISKYQNSTSYLPFDRFKKGKLTMGASTDSYIEYLLKNYLLTDKTEQYFYSLWHGAMDEMSALLFRKSAGENNLYFLDDLDTVPDLKYLFPNQTFFQGYIEKHFEEDLPTFIDNLIDFPVEYFSSLTPRFGINRKSQITYFEELRDKLLHSYESHNHITYFRNPKIHRGLLDVLRHKKFTSLCPYSKLAKINFESVLDSSSVIETLKGLFRKIETKYDFCDFFHSLSTFVINLDYVHEYSPQTTAEPYSDPLISFPPNNFLQCISDYNKPLLQCINLKLSYSNHMQHLSCFTAGMLLLGAFNIQIPHLDPRLFYQADQIIKTCYASYKLSPYSLSPDTFKMNMNPDKKIDIDYKSSLNIFHLRPEFIESLFYLNYFTKSTKAKEMCLTVLDNIKQQCSAGGIFTSIRSVPGKNFGIQRINKIESFWLSETLKYSFLLFCPDPPLSLDTWVFSTEAHPFPILKGGIPKNIHIPINITDPIWNPAQFYSL